MQVQYLAKNLFFFFFLGSFHVKIGAYPKNVITSREFLFDRIEIIGFRIITKKLNT